MKPNFLFAAACGFFIAAQAQAGGLSYFLEDFGKARAEGRASTMLAIDNDSLLLKRDDGFYSSGMRLTSQYALRDVDRLTIFGWRIGQDIYTASDIKLAPALVGPPDHPYAGWLYGGVFKESHRADGTYAKYGLDLGCLGPCAGGEWMQTNLHRLLRQPLPQGWSQQIHNEWGVVLHGELAPVSWKLGASVDATPSVHGRFGNIFTDGGAGLLLRAGALPALPGQDALYGFLRLDASAVAYNATLQGGYFSSGSPHTVKPKRWVGDVELGVAWRNGPYGASAAIVRRSNEIKDLPNSLGTQDFARLVFTYSP